MQNLLKWIDETAGLDTGQSRFALWLERAAFLFLILTALGTSISIAATQTAWLVGMFLWIISLFLRPGTKIRFGLLDYLFAGYLLWSVISAIFSYAPDISLDKLRNVSLFLIFYFAYHNLRTVRAVQVVAAALIVSAMVPVLLTPFERIVGRGVQIFDFRGSVLEKATFEDGDTVLSINNKKVGSLEELQKGFAESPGGAKFFLYRRDYFVTIDVPTDRVRSGETAESVLSIGRWQKGRTFRAAGFFGHYTTFAETLQLVLTFVFALIVTMVFGPEKRRPASRFFSLQVLIPCLALMIFAMILTATRGSQLAFVIAAGLCVMIIGNRKLIVGSLAIGLPLALAGLFFLQGTRQVGFFDPKDDSTRWRQTVYREAVDLWTASPRNFVFGVGMDSIKRYAKEWHLFDDGRLPMGHFHSTPLQIAVERGLPALLLWLGLIGAYLSRLWRYLSKSKGPPLEYGIVLGVFGATAGFFIGGFVHYNLGDSEVAMLFFMLMAVGLALISIRGNGERISFRSTAK